MALANKYRPKSFSEVIGQDNAVVALRNIIKNKNFHNGYIFSGMAYWWLILPAGLAVTFLAGGFYLVGRGLDDVFNPRLRKG